MTDLRTKTAEWYEVTAAVNRLQDNGTEKQVKEVYVVDTLSVSQAEQRVLEELAPLGTDTHVIKVQLMPVKEFIFSLDTQDETWYKMKIVCTTYDERSGKDKETSQYFMVQAHDTKSAEAYIHQAFSDSMCDYRIAGISETNVLDVYE